MLPPSRTVANMPGRNRRPRFGSSILHGQRSAFSLRALAERDDPSRKSVSPGKAVSSRGRALADPNVSGLCLGHGGIEPDGGKTH